MRNVLRRLAMLVPPVARIIAQRDALVEELRYLRSAGPGAAPAAAADHGTRDAERLLHRPPRELRAVPGRSAGEACDDAAMVQRVLRAYRASVPAPGIGPSAIWQTISETRQRPLHRILERGSPEEAGALLRRPGDSDLFWGFDGLVAESVASFERSPGYADTVARLCHDHLARAAEAMGALRCENLEAPGSTPMYGLMPTDDVLRAMDGALGCEIRFPNPYPDEIGVRTGRGIASFRAAQAIYQAWRIRELVRGIAAPRVLELGAGLGRTAYYARQLGIEDYTIIDLPFTGASQGYFLMRALGADQVLLHGEAAPDAGRRVKVLNPGAFLEGAERYDLVVNVDSLTEMDRPSAERYWTRMQQSAAAVLSINHEGNPFTVKELIDGAAARIASRQRHLYALRRGYVEELVRFRA